PDLFFGGNTASLPSFIPLQSKVYGVLTVAPGPLTTSAVLGPQPASITTATASFFSSFVWWRIRDQSYNNRDVVVAAAVICELDQLLGEAPVPGHRHDPLELARLDVVRHPVAAQQEAVARRDRHALQIGLDVALEADRLGDH